MLLAASTTSLARSPGAKRWRRASRARRSATSMFRTRGSCHGPTSLRLIQGRFIPCVALGSDWAAGRSGNGTLRGGPCHCNGVGNPYGLDGDEDGIGSGPPPPPPPPPAPAGLLSQLMMGPLPGP